VTSVAALAALLALVFGACGGSAGSPTRSSRASDRFEVRPVVAQSSAPCAPGQVRGRGTSVAFCYTLGPVALDGRDVASAAVSDDTFDGIGVDVVLTSAGLARLNDLASKQFGRPAPSNEVAMVVDGRVVSAPVVQSPTFDNPVVRVTGHFSAVEAKRVASAIGPPPKPSSTSTTSSAERNREAAQRAASQICEQHRREFPTGTTVMWVSAHSASEAVANIRFNGGDPAPWDHVPADDFVAECGYANLTMTSTPTSIVCGDGTIVMQDSTSSKHYYFDRAGHRSVVEAPRLEMDPCGASSPGITH
jgi:hypothetical protein